jgi:hypothetical protein
MKRTPFLICLAFVASMFFASCKNSGVDGLAVPKDAAFVVHVNTSSLTSKLSWKEIRSSAWFQEVSKNQHDSLTKKLLENPENSGIDLSSALVYFLKRQGTGGYMAFEGKLKDAAAFEAMVRKMTDGAESVKGDGFNFIKTADHSIVSWTKSEFIAMANDNTLANAGSFGKTRTYNMQPVPFSADSLTKFTKDLLNLKSDNSLAKDDRFSNLLKEQGDIHFWANSEQYMSAMGDYISMLKVGSLFEGNALGYTLNFDNGKISMKSKVYFGKEMQKMMSNVKSRNIDASLINRIPSQNVIGVMATSFDPAMLKEFVKTAGFDGLVNGTLRDMGLTFDEVINSINGDFLVTVTDFELKKKEVVIPSFQEGGQPYKYTRPEPDGNFLFAASVHDRPSFEKVLSLVKEKMGIDEEDSSKFTSKLTNDWFAASNRSQTVDQFLTGSNNKVAIANKISGHPFGMYIDLQKALASMKSQVDNASDSAAYDASVKMWQDILATGGEYKDGVASVTFEINLVDKSTNSLKQLSAYGDKMSAANKLRRTKDVVVNLKDTQEARPPLSQLVTKEGN